MHRRQAGFTLIEIMIVVMIVGLLMTAIATQLIGRAQRAQVDLTHTQLLQVEGALELYKLDNGRYPTSEQGLIALVRQPTSGPAPRRYAPGGYVRPKIITDPWGAPLLYQFPGTHNSASFDLSSFGPDGVEGGEGEDADIVNWNTETFE